MLVHTKLIRSYVHVVTTYGPVEYEVTYSRDGEEAASREKAQGENKEQIIHKQS